MDLSAIRAALFATLTSSSVRTKTRSASLRGGPRRCARVRAYDDDDDDGGSLSEKEMKESRERYIVTTEATVCVPVVTRVQFYAPGSLGPTDDTTWRRFILLFFSCPSQFPSSAKTISAIDRFTSSPNDEEEPRDVYHSTKEARPFRCRAPMIKGNSTAASCPEKAICLRRFVFDSR